MPEFVKKKWGFILVGLALLVLLKVFWPGQQEHDIPRTDQQTTETIEQKKPEQTFQLARKAPSPVPVNEVNTAVIKEDTTEVEEEYFEQEEEKQDFRSKSHILCEHIVSGETQYEFTGQIRLINRGTKPVFGWSVNWEYEDGSTIVEASGVALSGNNPYTGQYLSENAEILPGQTVTFGFTGIKNGESAPRGVNVTGEICM